MGVIGGGRFGTTLALELSHRGVDVIFLDRNRDVVQRMSNVVAKAVTGDAADVDVLAEAGFASCDTVIVALGSNVEASILATMSLKDLKVPRVVAKASTEIHGKVLERVGANQLVYPERDHAFRLARTLVARSVLDYIEVAEGTGIIEIISPSRYWGRTVAESRIRDEFGLAVLAIRHSPGPDRAGEVISVPSGTDGIQANDVMVLFGPEDKLREMERSLE
jgi:trk system potassium uptake protein TrkA